MATIRLSALVHNYTQVRRCAVNASLLAMVKSNGYGHGIVRVARTLSDVGADALGVACLEEALVLRAHGITRPIVVMMGAAGFEELALFAEHHLTPVIHSEHQVAWLEAWQAVASEKLSIWLKIDTGMHRLGFSVTEAESIYRRLRSLSAIQQPIGFMTHLADADDRDPTITHQQLAAFEALMQLFQVLSPDSPYSIANSAGILAYAASHKQWVRPGVMLYGVSPFLGRTGVDEGLQPVMTVSSKIIAKKQLKKGDRIGYGCTWICPEDMPVGVVAIGYGDGYPRYMKSGAPTLVGGQYCPLVGRVSMDMLTIDLRHAPQALIGDRVVLWGEGLPVEQVALHADTIPYTLFCGVTARVQFVEA